MLGQDVLAALPGVIVLAGALFAAGSRRPDRAVARSLIAQRTAFLVTAALALIVLSGARIDGVLFGLDRLAAVVALLTAGISFAVQTYARRYMDGDAAIRRFFRDMGLMAGAILVMVGAANALVFAAGWVGSSLALASLVAHRRDWAAARASARRTVTFLGIGDAALVLAALGAVATFGTADITAMAAAATARAGEPMVVALSLLLVVAALAKSAQLPLAGWLPETMTAPTPVSALMHAGFVNAGGYLLARFADVFVAQPALLALLFTVGAATALVGSLAMLVQSDVKRALGWSTVGQMGFMVMQCGLGAFAAAIYHLVAHGIFKATLFLGAGSVVQEARTLANAPAARVKGRVPPAVAAVSALAALAVAALPLWVAPGVVLSGPGLLLASFALMASVHALVVWNRHPRGVAPARWPGVLVVALGLVVYLAGTGGTALLLADSVPAFPATVPTAYAVVPLVFAGVLILAWTGVPRALHGLRDRLYARLLFLGQRPAAPHDTFSHRLDAA
jgi:NADH:ubiquinone oxidoreductase subunit 5 (subunit L)/multisubunit Na+/H+ antiporter MnhA subunit